MTTCSTAWPAFVIRKWTWRNRRLNPTTPGQSWPGLYHETRWLC